MFIVSLKITLLKIVMEPHKKVLEKCYCTNTEDKKRVNYKKACKRDDCERCGHSKHN